MVRQIKLNVSLLLFSHPSGHARHIWDVENRKCLCAIVKLHYPARARSARAQRACALRALGLLLYSRIPQWEGGRLFDRSAGFFYGNSCNSGTESRKIVPKVGN